MEIKASGVHGARKQVVGNGKSRKSGLSGASGARGNKRGRRASRRAFVCTCDGGVPVVSLDFCGGWGLTAWLQEPRIRVAKFGF